MTTPRTAAGRALWIPDYDARVAEFVVDRWPAVIVDKWEHNQLGERRFVDSRSYGDVAEARAAALDDVVGEIQARIPAWRTKHDDVANAVFAAIDALRETER